MPKVLNALVIKESYPDSCGPRGGGYTYVICEVQRILGNNRVFAIILMSAGIQPPGLVERKHLMAVMELRHTILSSLQNESYFTIRDLKGNKLSGSIFNILFNLNKFMAFETRDPFLIRQERENPNLTEWDRFAHREYIRLSMEEDAEDASNGSGDVWDESLEAPF
ncbi:hypothetical protein C3L33_20102, partial [Rhododendron williamsianum]